MPDQFFGRRGKQRIGFAGPDHNASRAEIAGEPHGFGHQVKRIGAHLQRGTGDIDVNIGHVERGEPKFPLLDRAAQCAALLDR